MARVRVRETSRRYTSVRIETPIQCYSAVCSRPSQLETIFMVKSNFGARVRRVVVFDCAMIEIAESCVFTRRARSLAVALLVDKQTIVVRCVSRRASRRCQRGRVVRERAAENKKNMRSVGVTCALNESERRRRRRRASGS